MMVALIPTPIMQAVHRSRRMFHRLRCVTRKLRDMRDTPSKTLLPTIVLIRCRCAAVHRSFLRSIRQTAINPPSFGSGRVQWIALH